MVGCLLWRTLPVSALFARRLNWTVNEPEHAGEALSILVGCNRVNKLVEWAKKAIELAQEVEDGRNRLDQRRDRFLV